MQNGQTQSDVFLYFKFKANHVLSPSMIYLMLCITAIDHLQKLNKNTIFQLKRFQKSCKTIQIIKPSHYAEYD